MTSPSSFSGPDYDEFLGSGNPRPYTYKLNGTSYPLDIVFDIDTWKFITDNKDLRDIIKNRESAFKGNYTICKPASKDAKNINNNPIAETDLKERRSRCIRMINKKIGELGLVLGHPDPSATSSAAPSTGTSTAFAGAPSAGASTAFAGAPSAGASTAFAPSTASSAAAYTVAPAKVSAKGSSAAPLTATSSTASSTTSSATSSATSSTTAAAAPPAVTPDPSGAVFKDVEFLDKTYPRVNQVATEGILYTSQKDLVDALFIGHLVNQSPKTKFTNILQAIIDGQCATDMPIITKTTCNPVRQWIRELMKLYLKNMDKAAVAAASGASGGISGASGGIPVAPGGIPGIPGGIPGASGGIPVAPGGIPVAPGFVPGFVPSSSATDPGAKPGIPGASGGIPVAPGGIPVAPGFVPGFVPSSSATDPGAKPVVPGFVPSSSATDPSAKPVVPTGVTTGAPIPLDPAAAAAAATRKKEAAEADAAFAAAEAEVARLLGAEAKAREVVDTYKTALTNLEVAANAAAAKKKEADAKFAAATNAFKSNPSEANKLALNVAIADKKGADEEYNTAQKEHNDAEIVYNKADRDLTNISESVKAAKADAAKAKQKTNGAKVAIITNRVTSNVEAAKKNIKALLDDSKNISEMNDMITRDGKFRNLSTIINVEKLKENINNANLEADAAAAAATEATAAAVTPEAIAAAQEATLAAAAVKTAATTASAAITAIIAMVEALSSIDKADPSADVKTITDAVKTNMTTVLAAMKVLADAMTARAVKVPAATPAPPQKRITIAIDIPKKALDAFLSESKS